VFGRFYILSIYYRQHKTQQTAPVSEVFSSVLRFLSKATSASDHRVCSTQRSGSLLHCMSS